jgi:hypothetical protein
MMKFFTRLGYATAALIALLASDVQAQESSSVRGTVTDKSDRSPLVGVSVAELDKTGRIVSGVLTDLNGGYLLKNVNSEHTITFSFIGFVTVKEAVNNRSVINVALESDVTTLQAVELKAERTTNTGMMEIDTRDLTTSAVKVDASDLAEIQATSIDQALQGRMAGVDIVANSGDPGEHLRSISLPTH